MCIKSLFFAFLSLLQLFFERIDKEKLALRGTLLWRFLLLLLLLYLDLLGLLGFGR